LRRTLLRRLRPRLRKCRREIFLVWGAGTGLPALHAVELRALGFLRGAPAATQPIDGLLL
jgi:hypothetical protein